MAHTKLSLEEGQHCSNQVIDWICDDDVEFVSFTVNGRTPSLSHVVGVDGNYQATPFLAMTEDGLGTVVYDAGFKKYTNQYGPTADVTQFNQLPAAFKVLYNAINTAANKRRIDEGKNSILVLGDAKANESYAIKSMTPDGFRQSIGRLCAMMGFRAVYKDRSDFPAGVLEPTLTELLDYCCVILVSSLFAGVGHISTVGANNLITFRETGNGIIIMTDSGGVVPTLEHATTGAVTGYFATANKVAANFGVYFSGDVNRTPVSVGHIRQKQGDSVLFANMTDDDTIPMFVGESRVFVTSFARYKPEELRSLSLVRGDYHIQILSKLKSGGVEIQRYRYKLAKNPLGSRRRLIMRQDANSPWVDNFSKGGWMVYVGKEDPEAKCKQGAACEWVKMTPYNTLLRSADNKSWEYVK